MKAQYSFIIDLSYDDNTGVSIFELGDLFTSSAERLDLLREQEGKKPLKAEYMRQLQEANSDAIYIETRTSFTNTILFHDFSNNHYEQYDCYGRHGSRSPEGTMSTIINLLKCRGLLGQHQEMTRAVLVNLDFVPSVDDRMRLTGLKNEKFTLLNYPQGVLREAARDKVVWHAFTQQSALCPKTVLLDFRCHDILANVRAFFKENNATHYVLKPTSLNQGMGIFIGTAHDVESLIMKLQSAINNSSVDIGFWSASMEQGNYFALLQTCAPSKEILFENKPYRPTCRVFITATFEAESTLPVLTVLGGYWELPKKSVKKSLTTVSLISPDGNYADCKVLPISAQDWDNITKDIAQHLPPVLLKMYQTPLALLEQQFIASQAMQAYSKYLGIDNLSSKSLSNRSCISPAQEMADIFDNQLEYCLFNYHKRDNYFKDQLMAPISLTVKEKITDDSKQLINPIDKKGALLSGAPLVELKLNNQCALLGLFFLYTGACALGIGLQTQQGSLVGYGILGVFAGICVKYIMSEMTQPHLKYSRDSEERCISRL